MPDVKGSLSDVSGNPYMESAVLFIATVSTVVCGLFTAPLLDVLGVDANYVLIMDTD